MAERYSYISELGKYSFRDYQADYCGPQLPKQGIVPMWWKRKEPNKHSEETRKDRGKLAEKLVELDRERSHLEELMKSMLAERAKNGRSK